MQTLSLSFKSLLFLSCFTKIRFCSLDSLLLFLRQQRQSI
uniref:Uncharacterized protein n=1 Tax=Anguilla anguilla TaxID=7936 RepID=A0A0E9SMI3_ANGAN